MGKPLIMGILNVTPDSFSGDGALLVDDALGRFAALVQAGADMIDLGAESTRPGAVALTDEEEWARLGPVLRAIADHPLRAGVKISVDSCHAATIEQALDYGIDAINDVSGLRHDAMLQIAARARCDVMAMHSLTVPADPAITWEEGADPVQEILLWKKAIQHRAQLVDMDVTRLVYDPGIGFGKTAAQSMALVDRAAELVASGGRWLFGHSRKSFLSLVTDAQGPARDAATLAVSRRLAAAGVHMVRVHNVAAHVGHGQ